MDKKTNPNMIFVSGGLPQKSEFTVHLSLICKTGLSTCAHLHETDKMELVKANTPSYELTKAKKMASRYTVDAKQPHNANMFLDLKVMNNVFCTE